MELEGASNEQVIEWFEARPEYREMIIEDMRKKLGLHFLEEFKHVFDHTDFLVQPRVGLIPTYILENLVDPTFEASADPDDFQRCIWQSLWFCVIQKTDHGGESLFFEPMSIKLNLFIRKLHSMKETEIERVNAGCDLGILVIKPNGLGVSKTNQWWAVVSLEAITKLIEELESRGEMPGFNVDTDEMLNQIYELRRLGKDYDKLLDQYLYQKLGRVI
jgi:hypothetical protein